MTNLTVNLENLTTEERATLTSLMTKANAPPQWEPKAGGFCVDGKGDVIEVSTSTQHREFGAERATQIEAEKASKAMRVHNRLLAYVAEFDTVLVTRYVCSIMRLSDGKYHSVRRETHYPIGAVHTLGAIYMSDECARELVKKLNSGEVVL